MIAEIVTVELLTCQHQVLPLLPDVCPMLQAVGQVCPGGKGEEPCDGADCNVPSLGNVGGDVELQGHPGVGGVVTAGGSPHAT